jgi:hypothetical protein
MKTNLKLNELPNIYYYLAVSFLIIIFNFVTIFGLKSLIADDQLMYNLIIRGDMPWWLNIRNPLQPYFAIPGLILMTHSLTFVRALYVILYLIPISCIFYYLLTSKFCLPKFIAFISAVVPNILPFQEIPAYILGSYTLYGMLFALLSLVYGLKYLETDGIKKWGYFIISIFLYFCCTQLMEQGVFLFPPLAFAFLFYIRLSEKQFYLIVTDLLIAAYPTYRTLLSPWSENVIPQALSIAEIFKRFEISLFFSTPLISPFSNLTLIYDAHSFLNIGSNVFFWGVVIAGFVIAVNNRNDELILRKKNPIFSWKYYISYIYLFFFIWWGSASFAFLTQSVYFDPRYFHLSSWGLNGLLVLSLFNILNTGFLKKYKIHLILLFSLLLYSGIMKYNVLSTRYNDLNREQLIIINSLQKYKLPKKSQVGILGFKTVDDGAGGNSWLYSSGYLEQSLKRNDIEGLLSQRIYRFYDPFDPQEIRGARGFNLNGRIFFFIYEHGSLKQVYYALQWLPKTKNWQGNVTDIKWTIYQFDKNSGISSIFKSGSSLKSYLATLEILESLGIKKSELLFGGIPSNDDYKKFNIIESAYFNKFIKIDSIETNIILEDNAKLLRRNISFGDKFKLIKAFVRQADKEKLSLYILWQALCSQKLGNYRIGFEIKNSDETLWFESLPFGNKNVEVKSGDFFFGSVSIPIKILNQSDASFDNLTIFFLNEWPTDWTKYPNNFFKTSEPRYGVQIQFNELNNCVK